jgi:N-acetylmuramoyl-L-alanine amidase
MAILKPDKTMTLGGVTVNEFLLTKHNPRNIAMSSVKMEGIIGVTVHNTDWIRVANGTTPAEQYTRATYNGNMNDVRVHYYVDHTCAWQNLPLDLSGWHAADGSGNGNRKTITNMPRNLLKSRKPLPLCRRKLHDGSHERNCLMGWFVSWKMLILPLCSLMKSCGGSWWRM